MMSLEHRFNNYNFIFKNLKNMLHVSESSLLSVVFLWLLQIAIAFSLLLVAVLCINVGLDVVWGVSPHPILNGNGAGSEKK